MVSISQVARWIEYFFLALAMSFLMGSAAKADKRVALVVGNSSYQNITRLDNPRNDANLMAETLRSIGFELVGGRALIDLDKARFDTAIQNFGNQLIAADVALFYYAGHGIQVRGSNYMMPVEANPAKEADVDFQMVDAALVLRQMEGSGTKLNLVILDACRNNPLGGRGLRSTGGGLAQMRAPEGTLISFATQPGNVAQDGDGGNSPYTKALAHTIRRAGLDVFQTFNEVGLAVKRSTGGQQQPWVSSSPIDGKFYFVGPQATSPSANSSATNEAAHAWGATKETTKSALLQAIIQRYTSSFYVNQYAPGQGGLSEEELAIAKKAVDPEGKLTESQRNMAALGSVYQYWANRGDGRKAGRVAFQMLQYYRNAAQRYAAIAAHAAQGDKASLAAEAAVRAYQTVPGGKNMSFEVKPDGGIFYHMTGPNGEDIAGVIATPEQLASSAMGLAKAGFDKALLSAAGIDDQQNRSQERRDTR